MDIRLRRKNIEQGINLNLIFTDKFKANLLNIYFVMPLTRKDVTKNALLYLVLKRRIEDLLVQKKLEELNCSSLSVRLLKEGEKQVISFSVEGPRLKSYKDKVNFMELINILKSLIYNPYPVEDVFSQKNILKEKDYLKGIIENRIKDEKTYSLERCIEEMYKNENFSLHYFGYIEDLDVIDNQTIYEHYHKVLSKAVIEIFYIGDFDEDLLKYTIDIFKQEREDVFKLKREFVNGNVYIKNMVYENRYLEPGRLVLGYRSGIPYESFLYNGLMIASKILDIKLKNMDYNINCIICKHKSSMIIEGYVFSKDFEVTLDNIRTEIENMKKGFFTKEDVAFSKGLIRNGISYIYENKLLLSDFYFSNIIMEDNRTIEEILLGIDMISNKDIMEAFQQIKADTIYFLGNPI